jgi:hypothetical protein
MVLPPVLRIELERAREATFRWAGLYVGDVRSVKPLLARVGGDPSKILPPFGCLVRAGIAADGWRNPRPLGFGRRIHRRSIRIE